MPSHFPISSSKYIVDNHIMAQKPDSSLRNRISELGASPKSYFSKTSTEPKPILDLLGKRQCGLEACVHTSLAKTISSFLTVYLQRIPKIPFVVLFPHRSSTRIFLMSSSALGPKWLYKVALAQQHFEMFSWCMNLSLPPSLQNGSKFMKCEIALFPF